MGHVIFGLDDKEKSLILEGKTCCVVRATDTLKKHVNKWFRVDNRMYRVLNTMKIDNKYITYFAFMGMYGKPEQD